MKQAREVALDALTACERQGAWSDGYLKKAIGGAKLDGRDAALATRLCFGVLQNRMLLDFYLSKLCATPLHKLEASIRNLLRLGAYQLLYLNRVPDHAAVSEAVSLARKKAKNPRAAGLVNGVLRSLIRQREALEPPADLSTRYSHPQWLVDSFVARLGREEAEALLAGMVLDTKQFTMRTGSRTFEAAAFLRRSGADTGDVKKLFQNDLEGTIAKYDIIQNAKMYREGIAVANRIAPEHLELCVDNPFDYLGEIQNAGSVFLGRYNPEPMGDYFAGPNHTLPTMGTARFYSPLSVDDFVKKSQFSYYTRDALARDYRKVSLFARKEGLDAHARAVDIRFEGGEA